MSEELINTWRPRPEIILNCPKGSRCVVQRPGPELGMEVARLQRTMQALRKVTKLEDGRTLEEAEAQKDDADDKTTPEIRQAYLDVMRATVAACVKRPRIYVNPKPGQTGVDDIPPEDFLHIWSWHKAGCPDVPIETEGGEVTAEQVNNFPDEQESGDGASDSGGDVRTEAEHVDAAA